MTRTVIPAAHGWAIHWTEPPCPGWVDGGHDLVIAWLIEVSDDEGFTCTERWAITSSGQKVEPNGDTVLLVFRADAYDDDGRDGWS